MRLLSAQRLLTASLVAGWLAGCARHTPQDAAKPPAPPPTPSERATVTAEDIARDPSKPVEELLAARVPGLTVTRTADGRLTLRIRGVTSLDYTEPLLVVDGIAIQPGMNDHLAGLNSDDIASVEVLKDAAATAMYGARGANGVILIKTKH
jgi:TonB-dependent SusC/RagA subfamily outer membrane receptor